jgi:hypothetical protein
VSKGKHHNRNHQSTKRVAAQKSEETKIEPKKFENFWQSKIQPECNYLIFMITLI